MATTATVRQLQCCALLEAQGYAPSGAAALVGNFSQESGANLPTAFRTGKLDHGSQGLAQWRLGRLTSYMAFVRAKHPELQGDVALWPWYGRLDYQCEFVALELKQSFARLDASLRAGGSVSALTADICWQYEKPSKAYANLAQRIAQATLVFDSAKSGHPSAKYENPKAAIDDRLKEHASQQAAGITAATGAAAVGVGTVAVHFASGFAWWEWTIFAVCLFIGICAFVLIWNHTKAKTLLTKARQGVDDTAPPSAMPTVAEVLKVPAIPEPAPVSVEQKQKINVQTAKTGEQAAIDAALAGADAVILTQKQSLRSTIQSMDGLRPPTAPLVAADGTPLTPLGTVSPGPILSVGKTTP